MLARGNIAKSPLPRNKEKSPCVQGGNSGGLSSTQGKP